MGDASRLQKSFGQASSSASSFGSKMASVGKVAGLAFAAGVGVAAVATVSFAKAALDAEKSQARLDAAFKHANASANDRADALKAVNDISVKSGLDDEDLADSLAKLTQVTGDATKATSGMATAADIARAKGIDLEAATGIVTKAALGNVGALKRQGIEIPKVTTAQDALKESHTKATAEQVKAAKAADDLATRQGALAALQKKFGGDAEEYGKTASGAMDRFKVAIENVQEGLGSALLPALASVAGGVADFLEKFNQAEGAGAKFKVVMDGIKTVASAAFDTLKTAVAGIDWGQVWDTVSASVASGASQLTSGFTTAVNNVNWGQVGQTAGDKLVSALNQMSAAVSRVNWDNLGQQIGEGLKKALGAAFQSLSNVDWMALFWSATKLEAKMMTVGPRVALGLLKSLGPALIDAVGQAFRSVDTWIAGQVSSFFSSAKNAGASIVKGIAAGLEGIGSKVKEKFLAVVGAVTSLAGQLHQLALNVGSAIIRGIGEGIDGMVGWLLGKAAAVVKKVKDILEFWKSPPDAYGKWIGGLVVGGIGTGMAEKTGEATAQASQVVAAIKTTFGTFEGVGDTMKTALSTAVSGAIDAATAIINQRKSEFSDAFGNLSSAVSSAFSTISGNVKTPAEKELAAIEKGNKEAALLQAESDAGILLANAKTDEEMLAAEKAYAAAEQAIQVYNLEQQAANERVGQNAINAVRSEALQAGLDAVGTQLANGDITYAQWHTRVMQLLSGFIPGWQGKGSELGQAFVDYLGKKVTAADGAARKLGQAHKVLAGYADEFAKKGKDLGQQFADGLSDKEVAVRKAANTLAKAAASALTIKVTATASSAGVDGARALGGPVTAGKGYIVGEKGPEFFVPKTSGMIVPNGGGMAAAAGGGTTVYNTFSGNYYGPGGIDELRRQLEVSVQRATSRNG